MRTKSFAVFRVFPLIVFASAFAALAADSGRYSGPTWAFLEAGKELEAAAAITLANYPDCDEAVVDKKMVRVYRPDGTGESQDDSFTKVLTEKGKRNNRTLSLSFMLPYFKVDVVKLELLKSGGKVVPVDVAANSKETIDDSQMSMNIYDPNNKVLKVNIPGLEVGDVVHAITRLTIERPIIPGEFEEGNVMEGQGYIRHLEYEVHAPAEKPLKQILIRDEIPGTITHTTQPGEDHTTIHRWIVNNVPRMFDEPAMPPYEMVLQRLLVSTLPDWQAVSKWYWDLSKPHLEATAPEMKETVDKLTAGAATDLDKVKAIFYHVSKKIRYMGLTPEKDRPGFEPHDVKLTFEKKYGVCRDKAALLVSMLRAAGLKSYPVLISVGSKRDPQVPDPFFNHAIVSVELKPGDYTLMDPTDENTRDLLPSSECDQSYLVCRPDGENLKISTIKPPEENMMRVTTTGTLDATGRLQARSELSFDGINDNSYRDAFAHMKPDDQRRFFERLLKRGMPGARLKTLQLMPEDMLDVSAPVRAVLEFSVDGMTASGHGKAIVSVPWLGKNLGIVNFILGGTGLEKRKYPMQTYVACGLDEQISLKLADGFTGAVSMPSCSPEDDPCLAYHQQFSFQDRSLACSRALKLKVVEFSPKQYLQLKKTLENLEFDERKAPVMALAETAVAAASPAREAVADPPVESNAKVIESHKELDIHDAHSSVYRCKYSKQILTYNGKIREAEVKIDFNPACEQARIVRAAVTSKTGQRQEISPGEMNVMDAGWNASAKRYTGGKILVANLPGVDIGSTIEVEYEVTSTNKPFLAGYEAFQLVDAMDHKSVRITAPAGLHLQKIVTGPSGCVKETTRTEGDKQVFEWTTEKVKATPAESQLPPEWIYNPGVAYFTGDAAAYYKALSDTLLDRAAKSTQAGQKAKQLIASAKDRREAATAIRDFIARSIRLAGPSFTSLPLSELSPADTTLSDGYGHMADRAILYYAMLTAAGFKPEFVLASGLPPISEIRKVTDSFPLPGSFQAPLVRVEIDGEVCYLNDTDQYAHLGSTSYDGRLALQLPSRQFSVIHAAKDCQNKTDSLYTLSLANDGKTRIQISRRFYGSDFNGRNRFFSELPPEERRRYFQEIVSNVAQGARPVGGLTTKFDTYPGLEQFTVEVDHYVVVDGKCLYFDLPFTPSLFPAGADQRTLPLFVSTASTRTVRTEIDLPPNHHTLTISPPNQDLQAPAGCGRARIHSTDSNGKIIITHEFDTDPAIVDPKDYPAMLQVEANLGKKSSRTFLVEE